MSGQRKGRLLRAFGYGAAALLFVALLVCEIGRKTLFETPELVERGLSESLYNVFSRIFGGLLCLLMLIYCSYQGALKLRPRRLLRALAICLPFWVIVINNFPWIPFLEGRAYLVGTRGLLLLYAAECLAIGFFEEIAFRGCAFLLILQNRRKTTREIFWSVVWSSAVFGGIHLVNLFFGASPLAVILQVGYSFLIGAMCAIVLLRTGSIWHCVGLHAVYNFCGGVIPRLGDGVIWDTPTVVLTVVLSLLVVGYAVYLMVGTKYEHTAPLFEAIQRESAPSDANEET
jgi:membrane protease YdiL (CAAX protease family)